MLPWGSAATTTTSAETNTDLHGSLSHWDRRSGCSSSLNISSRRRRSSNNNSSTRSSRSTSSTCSNTSRGSNRSSSRGTSSRSSKSTRSSSSSTCRSSSIISTSPSILSYGNCGPNSIIWHQRKADAHLRYLMRILQGLRAAHSSILAQKKWYDDMNKALKWPTQTDTPDRRQLVVVQAVIQQYRWDDQDSKGSQKLRREHSREIIKKLRSITACPNKETHHH